MARTFVPLVAASFLLLSLPSSAQAPPGPGRGTPTPGGPVPDLPAGAQRPGVPPRDNREMSRLEIVSVQQGTDSRNVVIRRWRARSPPSADPVLEQHFALRRRSSGEVLMGGVDNSWQLGGRPNAAMMLVGVPLVMRGARVPFWLSGEGFSVGTMYIGFPDPASEYLQASMSSRSTTPSWSFSKWRPPES